MGGGGEGGWGVRSPGASRCARRACAWHWAVRGEAGGAGGGGEVGRGVGGVRAGLIYF